MDKLDQAIEFLKELLEEGPQLSKDVNEGAKAHNITNATLRRAKEELRIKTWKGEGEGKTAPWYCELPPKRTDRRKLTPLRGLRNHS